MARADSDSPEASSTARISSSDSDDAASAPAADGRRTSEPTVITHSSRAPVAVPDPVTQMPLSMPTSCVASVLSPTG